MDCLQSRFFRALWPEAPTLFLSWDLLYLPSVPCHLCFPVSQVPCVLLPWIGYLSFTSLMYQKRTSLHVLSCGLCTVEGERITARHEPLLSTFAGGPGSHPGFCLTRGEGHRAGSGPLPGLLPVWKCLPRKPHGLLSQGPTRRPCCLLSVSIKCADCLPPRVIGRVSFVPCQRITWH